MNKTLVLPPRATRPRALRAGSAVLLLVFLSSLASAHDTWFEAKTQKRSGRIVMALGTGNQFPLLEFPLALAALHSSGCRQGAQTMALKGMTATPKFTLMQTEAKTQNGISSPAEAISCWAQSVPFDIEIPADKVALYFDEINPPQATRDRWAALQARGLPWLERYVKHARIEFASPVPRAEPTPVLAPAVPSGMGMDLLIQSGLRPLRSGDALVFQVLRDAAPLADFAVELRGVSTVSGQERWLRTDAQGMVRTTAPAAGRWLLRGTDLRLAAARPDQWDSRFITLAFDVY
jgi:hypothetical protein